jgi:type III restriction enzyme
MRCATTCGAGARRGWAGASETTKTLLRHWWREDRTRRLFFCQIEAAETVIYLREMLAQGRVPRFKPQISLADHAALMQGRNPRPDEWVAKVAQHPKLADLPHEAGAQALTRYACKMATGSGKTVLMALLLAWAFCNRGRTPSDSPLSAPGADRLPQPDHQGPTERAAPGRCTKLL